MTDFVIVNDNGGETESETDSEWDLHVLLSAPARTTNDQPPKTTASLSQKKIQQWHQLEPFNSNFIPNHEHPNLAIECIMYRV